MSKLNNKVILDVDTGVDDALSIIYGIESKQIDFLGITTVSGNVPLEMVFPSTLKVLKLIGREDIPVLKGASQPLIREPFYEYKVHGKDGIGNALDEIELGKLEDTKFAPDFIIEQAEKHKGKLTLIMVGPLTNLALALRKERRLATWVDEVIIMGGLVSNAGRGNTLPTSEFNIYADAEAARIVFHSGIDATLVSLDVTMQTNMTREDIEQLKGTKYYDFVLRSTEVYRSYSEKALGINGCSLHDPLTIGYFLDRSYLNTEKYYVDVETESALSYGQTICDFHHLLGNEPNINICTDVDAKRFVNDFLNILKNQKAD